MGYRTLPEEECRDLQARILYEDNHLLAFNKRSGEIVQGDRTGDECLAETLKAYLAQRDAKPGNVFLGVPHRLDRPVGGVTLFAKTSKALGRLGEMFRDGNVQKSYWALCCQAPPSPHGVLKDWLVRNEKQNKSYVVSGPANGAKEARLTYTHLLDTDRYALLEVQLHTGRHHQIRCQLSHLGCPIKGDLKYGAPRSNPDGSICLLSKRIRFVHPVKKTALDITAPVPPSWKGVPGHLPSEREAR